MKKNLLITGISGLLGSNLAYALRDKFNIVGWYNYHKVFIPGVDSYKADITDKQSIKEFLSDYQPGIIIHCASLTDIDYCEKNKEETRRVNVEGTRNILFACANQDTKLVYISTDAVYEGKMGNYAEDSPVSPRNCYGLTKYEAEAAVREHKNHIIARTNIFGWNIQDKFSLAEWILDSLQRGSGINCFTDAIFSSIYTLEFAGVVDMMLDKDLTGTFNLASRTSLSKYEFAALIAETFNLDKALIKPVSIEGHSFSAGRGKNLSLDTRKLSRALAHDMPSIEECVQAFFKDYKSGIRDEIKNYAAII